MKIKKVGNVFVDWMKGTYRFGSTFTNYLAARTEMSPLTTRIAGGLLDLGGAWLFGYCTVAPIIGTVVGIAAAAAAFAAAPLAAVGAVALGTAKLALFCLTISSGFGFLSAARAKSGLPSLASLFRGAKSAVSKGAEKVAKPFKKAFKADAKITNKFKNAANNNQPPVNTPKKPAPKLKL
jgi:hypothetical protein